MTTDPDKVGSPSTSLINRLQEGIRRLLRFAPGPGIVMEHTPSGRALALDRPHVRFWARLVSGPTSGPFVFRRVHRLADGSWVDLRPVNDVTVAYEANLQTPTLPKIVLLEEVGLGTEYRFALPRGAGPALDPCEALIARGADLYLDWVTAPYWFVLRGNPAGFLVNITNSPFTFVPDGTFDYYPIDDVSVTDVSGGTIPFGSFENPLNTYAGPYWKIDDLAVSYPLADETQTDGYRLVPGSISLRYTCRVVATTSPVYPVGENGLHGLLAVKLTITDPLGSANVEFYSSNAFVACLYTSLIGGCPRSIGPLCTDPWYQTFSTAFVYYGGESWTIREAGTLTTAISVCADVRTCPAPDGSPVVGQTVQLLDNSGSTALQTASTNGSGRACFSVSTPGYYRLRTSSGGCDTETVISVPFCSAVPIIAELINCCAWITLHIQAFYADGTVVDVEGTEVRGLGPEPYLTDAAGLVSVPMLASFLASMPASSGDCTSRLVTLRVRSAQIGTLDYCPTVAVPCGQTESYALANPVTITLLNVYRAPVPPATEPTEKRYTTDLTATCATDACTATTYLDHQQIPTQQAVALAQLRYQFDDGFGVGTYDLRPGGLSGGETVLLNLDETLLAGDPVVSGYSPFDTTEPPQRIEYRLHGTGNWTRRGGTSPRTVAWTLFWCHGAGLVLRLETSGFDPEDPFGAGTLTVPPAVPEGSGVDTAQAVLIRIPATTDVCNYPGSDVTLDQAGAMENGLNFQAQASWSEA